MSSSTKSTTTDLAYIAVFAALIIVMAFVSIPVGTAGVPIVMQNAMIILAGLILGGRRGFLATALFLLLGIVGIPVLAGGRSTLAALAGPTVGYLVGYLISAWVAGIIAYRSPRAKGPMTAIMIAAGIAGLAIQYICGVVGLIARAHLSFGAALAAQVPFLLPDFIKIVVAALIAVAVHSAFPDLIARRARR